ncbi:MAG: fluoride efflux transporter FluC [Minwuia sp.]|uniref:fluoride efflux transporter FluC n=1 Tax=Minwuia sp. TaxID=2493630 RepID=UPI003A89A53E
MNMILAIAAGGALGAVSRYGVQILTIRLFGTGFPFGTLAVNVAGSLIMGFVAQWFLARGVSAELRSFVMVGGLGALTTFSTFSLDAVAIYERGEPGLAALYVGLSVLLSIGGLVAGLAASRAVFA